MIYGRGGSGKSRSIYKEISQRMKENPDREYIILVPEQYTFRAEQKVLKELGQSSVFRVSVLSFNSLGRRILSTVGGATRSLITDIGKTMLMTKALVDVKEEMNIFKRVSGKTGFIEMAKNLVDEIKRYDVDMEKMKTIMMETEDKELKNKLSDIILFYEAYEREIHKDYIDATDQMNFALEKIVHAEFLKNAEVYIDEFNDFSVMQQKFIEAMLRYAKRVVMTLTLDKVNECGDVFQITKDTETKIFLAAERAGTQIEKPLVLDAQVPLRFQLSPELCHLEREYFRYPNRTYMERAKATFLYKAQNSYDEVEKVAVDIRRRIRQDESLRYRDIAILCRNIDVYENIVVSVFKEYEIPVFLDKRRDMDGNPLAQYLLSFLEIVSKGFTYESLFKMLKTGLSPVTEEESDLLENYILAHGIKGGTFEKEWKYPYPNMHDEVLSKLYLARANEIRTKIQETYGTLRESILHAENIREVTKLLYLHLEEGGIIEKSFQMVNRMGNFEIKKEHEEVIKGIIEVFDDIVDVLGEDKLEITEYTDILKQAMLSLKIALIPLTLDQVILGDVARVKSDNIRGLYILGVNDGVFPRTISDEGLITDRDIMRLKEKGLDVFIDSKTRSVYEQFLVYTAFTIPGEFIQVSYVSSDMDGKSQRPSLVIGRLKKLFPKLVEETYVNPMDKKSGSLDEVEGKKATFNHLIKEMRRNYQGDPVNPLWGEVYSYYENEDEFRDRLKISKAGLRYTNTTLNLTRASVKSLYGDKLYLSVSRLEKFTSCPFAYYVQYGLKAKDRVIHEVTAPDVGTLMHDVIDKFTEDIKGMQTGTSALDREFIRETVDRLVEDAISNTNTIYKSSPRYRHMGEKVKKILNRSLETITAQIAKGSFVPMFNELGFGKDEHNGKEGKLPPLSIEIPETGEDAFLRGRIDRIDVMEMDGKSYIRIIDYKSSAKDVSLKDVFYGLQLQLLVYLDVIMKNWDRILVSEAVPGAILYFRLDNPIVKGSVGLTDEEVEKKVMESLRLKGLILNDARIVRSMDKDIDEYSLVIPAKFNKAGEVVSSSNRKEKNSEIILSEEEFDNLRDYVRESIGRILKELFDGNISILPYKDKEKIPCTYCTYKSICQFDTKIEENHYRNLKALSIEALWANMKAKKGGEEDGE